MVKKNRYGKSKKNPDNGRGESREKVSAGAYKNKEEEKLFGDPSNGNLSDEEARRIALAYVKAEAKAAARAQLKHEKKRAEREQANPNHREHGKMHDPAKQGARSTLTAEVKHRLPKSQTKDYGRPEAARFPKSESKAIDKPKTVSVSESEFNAAGKPRKSYTSDAPNGSSNQRKEDKTGKSAKLKRKVRGSNPIANAAAAVIDAHDRMQAASDRFFGAVWYSFVEEMHDAVIRYKTSGRQMAQSLMVISVISCIMLLIFNKQTVYEYSYNGRVLGYVESQETVTQTLDVAGKQLSDLNAADITFRAYDNVLFRPVSAQKKDIDDADTVVNKLTYMTDLEVDASGIFEDGKLSAVVENSETAKAVMKEVLSNYENPDNGMHIIKSEFAGKVETKPITVMLKSIQSFEQAKQSALDGGEMELQHIVNEKETRASIAKMYNADKSAIMNLSEGTKAANKEPSPGDKIEVKAEAVPLRVRTVEQGKRIEAVKYETEKKETKELYKGDREVKQKGEYGRQVVTGKITKVNDKEVKRDIESTEVIKEPVTKIILIGTSNRPKTAPTGHYILPVRTYTVTSYFGGRWGRMHEGLDFGAPTGTPIYAADGGTVTNAGGYGGYGLCIDINHEKGRMTRYGHCSSIVVSNGDKVYQGQLIGYVGNTGNSTGPHLHFETRQNGTALDPLKYINP